MRVNVYAEEITHRVEIISKEVEGQTFTGVRFYLELPASFIEGESRVEDIYEHLDSAAITFWGKTDLRVLLTKALHLLDRHYIERDFKS